MKISLIVAVSRNGIIGRLDGTMPWHIKEEFKHFKNTTLGHPILMGRKTFETLGKPLKGRLNIIITRNKNYKTEFDDVKIISSLSGAIEYCKIEKFEQIFVIGGGEIYKQAIDIVDEMIISTMKFDAEGEVKFPDYNPENWKETEKQEHDEFKVNRYERQN